MIHFILLQNKQGKTRISKWYSPFEHEEKRRLESEIHRVLIRRPTKFSSFIEFRKYTLVYRRYAGLYFTLCVDPNDNELSYLEAIHLFVEILDKYFGSVCELDLVFGFYKVFALLDEFVCGGEIQETSKKIVMGRIRALEDHEKKSK
mmetsp:Transcript_24186/g.40720  ORF Transcript_24186/g.40720 Transcript_24186/m.40720 type:complete len:147 (+) Transcript_24186:3-443(+)|eukprot:jgi/Bigna1/91595/estExt_fgenesh1_pg.C_1080023